MRSASGPVRFSGGARTRNLSGWIVSLGMILICLAMAQRYSSARASSSPLEAFLDAQRRREALCRQAVSVSFADGPRLSQFILEMNDGEFLWEEYVEYFPQGLGQSGWKGPNRRVKTRNDNIACRWQSSGNQGGIEPSRWSHKVGDHLELTYFATTAWLSPLTGDSISRLLDSRDLIAWTDKPDFHKIREAWENREFHPEWSENELAAWAIRHRRVEIVQDGSPTTETVVRVTIPDDIVVDFGIMGDRVVRATYEYRSLEPVIRHEMTIEQWTERDGVAIPCRWKVSLFPDAPPTVVSLLCFEPLATTRSSFFYSLETLYPKGASVQDTRDDEARLHGGKRPERAAADMLSRFDEFYPGGLEAALRQIQEPGAPPKSLCGAE